MKQFVVILRGTPASGKSTIAARMRDFDKKIAWLKVDNFKDFFADDSSIALDYVNGSAIATLDYLLSEGFSVVMEGVFQDPTYIQKAVDVTKKRNIQCKVFEIKCSLQTLQKRDLERPGVKEGIRKALGDTTIEKIYRTIKEKPYIGAFSLDTENNSIEDCIIIISEQII